MTNAYLTYTFILKDKSEVEVEREAYFGFIFAEGFGLKDSSSGSVSRLIKETVELNLIKPLDPTTAPRYMKYIPIWA